MRLTHFVAASLCCVTLGAASAEEIAWSLSSDLRAINLVGAAAPTAAHLGIEGAEHQIPLEIVTGSDGDTTLRSTWPLMPGAAYQVSLQTRDGPRSVAVAVPQPAAAAAAVTMISPGDSVLPENLLRIHVHFETPMARGQVFEAIGLVDQTGMRIPDAFLNLGVELWSPDHRRLTLLFDPGRIKRGVGPNVALGAPLKAGNRYAIEVAGSMRDAHDRPLSASHTHWFDVGPAERRMIDPKLWDISMDHNGVQVRFGRLMDAQSVLSTISLQDDRGQKVTAVTSDGDTWHWHFGDDAPAGALRFVVGAGLEDVAGNTLCGPFDTAAGSARTCEDGRVIPLKHLQ